MKHAILALEDIADGDTVANIDPAQLTEEHIDAAMVEQQAELAELHGEADEVKEAQGMADTIESMAHVAEQAIQSEEGLAQPTAEVMEAAMEHFYVRLGIKRKAFPALESFEKDRLASTKITLEHLRDLQARIDKNLTIAQEGLFARIGNAFSRAFTSSKKISKALSAMNASELAEPHDLGSPAWARVFGGISGKKSINSSDIATVFAEIHGLADDLAKHYNRAAVKIDGMHKQLQRSTFGAAEGAVEAIQKLGDELLREVEQATRKVPERAISSKKDTQVLSCDKANFSRIVKEAKDYTDFEGLSKAYSKYYTALGDIGLTRTGDNRADMAIHLVSLSNADRRAVNEVLKKLNRIDEASVEKVLAYEWACVHGAYKYLLASKKK